MSTGDTHSPGRAVPSKWVRRLAIPTIWLLISFIFTTQNFYYSQGLGQAPQWRLVWQSMAYYCALWALATPLVIFLSRKFRIGRGHTVRNILIHLFCAVALSVIHRVLYVVPGFYLSPVSNGIDYKVLSNAVLGSFDYGVYVYLIILFVEHALSYFNEYQAQQVHAAQLRGDLAGARLKQLTMQLQPHFLFNTLNSISVLIKRDPRAATDMLEQLSDLLRLTLQLKDEQEISLSRELDLIDHYLRIEQVRFGDRLTVIRDIDAQAASALVPPLALQTIVENALRHGIEKIPGPGTVEIAASRLNGTLRLAVRDSGPGMVEAAGQPQGERGIGLSNTHSRLAHLYDTSYKLEFRNTTAGGSEVIIEIPFHTSEPT